jgi:hypothetical protein
MAPHAAHCHTFSPPPDDPEADKNCEEGGKETECSALQAEEDQDEVLFVIQIQV